MAIKGNMRDPGGDGSVVHRDYTNGDILVTISYYHFARQHRW